MGRRDSTGRSKGDASEARLAGGLLLAGTLPILAARVLGPGGAAAGILPACPLRAFLGVPCPLCGATRAVALAGAGDPAFLQFNAPWVLALGACIAAAGVSLALLVSGGRPRPLTAARARWRELWASRPLLGAALVALALAVPWAWALAHRATIAPGA